MLRNRLHPKGEESAAAIQRQFSVPNQARTEDHKRAACDEKADPRYSAQTHEKPKDPLGDDRNKDRDPHPPMLEEGRDAVTLFPSIHNMLRSGAQALSERNRAVKTSWDV